MTPVIWFQILTTAATYGPDLASALAGLISRAKNGEMPTQADADEFDRISDERHKRIEDNVKKGRAKPPVDD